jgi:two-component system KDP operon response regulator KdpE
VEPLVLAVDDEPGILRLINLVLSNNGFRVMVAEDGMEALRIAERHRPDLVILDVRMPQMGGIEVMRKLRERITTPIILLTAKSNDEDKIFGLESGADDYLVKPFNPGELSARARAVIRRSHRLPGNGTTVKADGVEVDLDRRLVTKDGQLVSLTRTEWRLLQELATNAGRVMLNAELLGSVWGSDYRDDLQYLRVWISRLRSKIERVPGDPKILVTFPGIGYMFTSAGSHENGNGDVSYHNN